MARTTLTKTKKHTTKSNVIADKGTQSQINDINNKISFEDIENHSWLLVGVGKERRNVSLKALLPFTNKKGDIANNKDVKAHQNTNWQKLQQQGRF